MKFAILLTLASLAFAEDRAFLGRWSTGSVSTVQYKNSVTGVAAPATGNRFSWEFRADGTYNFTGLMQSTFYSCTTSTFMNESGTYELSGDVISVKPEKNPYQMRYSCSPSSDNEKPGKLIPKSYRVRVLSDSSGQKLELISTVDNASQIFRKDR
ncbi:hypothetical protein [Bryobacter aggregatus]|uniref:hypothetical protein n=1 Tax=Bryobacter aggregatus TaxID=360054 RepID=UPI00055A99D1|nr:hypothetical protein [Bryobacter aggregatus]